jgi:predicted ATPase
VAAGVVTSDPKQAAALQVLDSVFATVLSTTPPEAGADAANDGEGDGTWSGKWARRIRDVLAGNVALPTLEHDYYLQVWNLKWQRPVKKIDQQPATGEGAFKQKQQGLYMYGDVGCGKTMLMDLLFHTLPVDRKKRVHFHAFMLDIHHRVRFRNPTHV